MLFAIFGLVVLEYGACGRAARRVKGACKGGKNHLSRSIYKIELLLHAPRLMISMGWRLLLTWRMNRRPFERSLFTCYSWFVHGDAGERYPRRPAPHVKCKGCKPNSGKIGGPTGVLGFYASHPKPRAIFKNFPSPTSTRSTPPPGQLLGNSPQLKPRLKPLAKRPARPVQ